MIRLPLLSYAYASLSLTRHWRGRQWHEKIAAIATPPACLPTVAGSRFPQRPARRPGGQSRDGWRPLPSLRQAWVGEKTGKMAYSAAALHSIILAAPYINTSLLNSL
jgi:hypothetical protein